MAELKLVKNAKEKFANDLKEKEVKDKLSFSDEDAKTFEEMCELAKMPIKYNDSDFKLGERELDIRELNAKNLKQLQFRLQVLENVYLKGISDSLIDLMRILIVIGKKVGVNDIEKEIADYLAEAEKKIN